MENSNDSDDLAPESVDLVDESDHVAEARVERFEFGKGYDMQYFQHIRVYLYMNNIVVFEFFIFACISGKYQGRRKKKRRRVQPPIDKSGVPTYPSHPAYWPGYLNRKGCSSSRRTAITDIVCTVHLLFLKKIILSLFKIYSVIQKCNGRWNGSFFIFCI